MPIPILALILGNCVPVLSYLERNWSPEKKGHSAEAQSGLLTLSCVKAWNPQECPFLDGAVYLERAHAVVCLHFPGHEAHLWPAPCPPGQGRTSVCQLLALWLGLPGMLGWPFTLAALVQLLGHASVGGQPASACMLQALALSPH